jgi:hypothetical protein
MPDAMAAASPCLEGFGPRPRLLPIVPERLRERWEFQARAIRLSVGNFAGWEALSLASLGF